MNHATAQTQQERNCYSVEKRFYSIGARFYDTVMYPFRKLREDVVRAVKLSADASVLDVATGTGAQAYAFAPKVREVVGVDISEAMLRVARRKNRFDNVRFFSGDAAALPFSDAGFDASCISFALHEMPGSIRERVLREMARVTKPGGSVIIVDYTLPRRRVSRWLAYHFIKLYEPKHYASFVQSNLDSAAEDAGIDVSEWRPVLGGIAAIVIGRRRETAGRRFGDGERDLVEEASWESFPASDPPAY